MASTIDIDPIPNVHDVLKPGINHNIDDDPLSFWDRGVFLNELLKQGIVLAATKDGGIDGDLVAKKGLKTGTYKGTRMALTELYSLIEEAYDSSHSFMF
jgi:hypothetical protein